MSLSAPEIAGYQFDQRVLEHPLAELWHGRSFTGMEVVALVLSEAGARDATVRERLVRAGRDAALEPERLETPLWAANFSTDRPYAITQLIPGQTGAERLVDPLDGVLGNQDESLRVVRAQLSRYGAMAPSLPPYDSGQAIPSYADHPQTAPQSAPTGSPSAPSGPRADAVGSRAGSSAGSATKQPRSKVEVAREYRRRMGAGVYGVAALIVLIVFTVAYSVGTAIGGSVKDEPTAAAPVAAVSPGAYPSPVLLPAIEKITTGPYKRPDGSAGVFGATYAAGTDLQVITTAELPFALGWPRPPQVTFLGESSSVVYRRIQTKSEYSEVLKNSLDARLALHPCASLAGCLADRASFDQHWTKVFKASAPATAKDARTWLTERKTSPYAMTMTRAFLSGGRWWLVGAAVTTNTSGEEPDVQRIVNDIWRQTS